MLILTLPVALSVLGYIYKSPVFSGNMETNTKYEIAWKASLDVVAAMAKDNKMAETLNAADWEQLQDVASYLDRIDSPPVLLTLLEEVLRVPKVESIVKLYPEYELTLSATKDLVITITTNFGLPEMTQENWKGLLLKTRLETTSKDLNYRGTADCTAICEKQIKNDENFLELMTTDNRLRNTLGEMVPKTLNEGILSLQMSTLLKLPDLADMSSNFLQNVLSVDNVVHIFQASFRTEMVELKRKAEEYLFWEFNAVAKNGARFTALNVEELFYLVVSEKVNVPNEYSIFQAIERWANYGLSTRKEHVPTLMTTVRLYLCSVSELNGMLNSRIVPGLESVQQSIRSAIYLIELNAANLPDLIQKQKRNPTKPSLVEENRSTVALQWKLLAPPKNNGFITRT